MISLVEAKGFGLLVGLLVAIFFVSLTKPLLNSLDSIFTNSSLIEIIVLAVTAFILLKTALISKESNELQIRPFIDMYVLKFNRGPNTLRKFLIKNTGKGPAYNIKIERIKTPQGYYYGPFLDDSVNSRIESGGESEVRFWIKTPDNATSFYEDVTGFQFFLHRAFYNDENRPVSEGERRTNGIFLVHYEGVNGVSYYAIFRFYPSLPLMSDDIIFQFVSAGRGEITTKDAYALCLKKRLNKHIGEQLSEENQGNNESL